MSESTLRTLIVNYQRTAKDYVKRYQDESEMNGLVFDFHKESLMAEAFTRALQIAGQKFLEDPLYSPHIPNWNRVVAAIPDFWTNCGHLWKRKDRTFLFKIAGNLFALSRVSYYEVRAE